MLWYNINNELLLIFFRDNDLANKYYSTFKDKKKLVFVSVCVVAKKKNMFVNCNYDTQLCWCHYCQHLTVAAMTWLIFVSQITNDDINVPFVVITIQSLPNQWLVICNNSNTMGDTSGAAYHSGVSELDSDFSGVLVDQCLVFCMEICWSLLVPFFFFFWPLYCLSFFFWPLYCLSFFELRLLITPLVSPDTRIFVPTLAIPFSNES
jgi:hypothetical protein